MQPLTTLLKAKRVAEKPYGKPAMFRHSAASRCWLLGRCTSYAELIWATKMTTLTLTWRLLQSFPQVMNLIRAVPAVLPRPPTWGWGHRSSNPLSTLVSWGSPFFDWPIASHFAFCYIQMDTTSSRYFKQYTYSSPILCSSQPSCRMDSTSKWWERVILFSVQHTFSFRFLSLGLISDCLMFGFSGYTKYCKSTAALGCYTMATHVL